jgi:hypothetical protein
VVLSGSAAGAQAPTVITDEFSKFVQDTMQANNVSGLSVGVLRPDGQVEYGSWGERTEEGDPITPGVWIQLFPPSTLFSCSVIRHFSTLVHAPKHFFRRLLAS